VLVHLNKTVFYILTYEFPALSVSGNYLQENISMLRIASLKRILAIREYLKYISSLQWKLFSGCCQSYLYLKHCAKTNIWEEYFT